MIVKGVRKQMRQQIETLLQEVAFKKPSPMYDRIYVTTLFTFYWKITIKTIKVCKNLVKDDSSIKVGGVLASLLSKELEDETGIVPVTGLLDKAATLDSDSTEIIDDLPLDYSILDEIDYEYPTGSAYITFMTKGCTRSCAFCSVPILEPTYKDRVPTLDKFIASNGKFGEKRNLLLMDNNVLASARFPEIVKEIMQMGFYKGATYQEPNQLELAIQILRQRINDVGTTRRIVKLLSIFVNARLRGGNKRDFQQIINKYQLASNATATRANILKSHKIIAPIYERYRSKTLAARYVDFNQGIDGRYVNETNMALLSELNVRPLRIAFDFIGMKKQYVNAVELAAKFNILNLSNYILYNFKDSPSELYERLEINIKLNERLGTKIFSFPMKYIPLFGEDAKGRNYIGPKWNKKFIRAVQSILNVTKGIVAPGSEFFEVAFGQSLSEYLEILYMPETFIIYRKKFELSGLTRQWRNDFLGLLSDEAATAKSIIEQNDFSNQVLLSENRKVRRVLSYYTITDKDLNGVDLEYEQLKQTFNKLVQENMFVNLTLTYDYQ